MSTAVAAQLSNSYWEEVRDYIEKGIWGWPTISRLDMYRNGGPGRDDFCRTYCWAVPDPVSLDFVARALGPRAVEMGAGTGYWAAQLVARGVDILAFDRKPPQLVTSNGYHSPIDKQMEFTGELREAYFDVQPGEPELLSAHSDRALFLCWPPYDDEMAGRCLSAYQGSRLVYIGEGSGGCNGDDAFFAQVAYDWRVVGEHRPMQWDGIHDLVYIYERKKRRRRMVAT